MHSDPTGTGLNEEQLARLDEFNQKIKDAYFELETASNYDSWVDAANSVQQAAYRLDEATEEFDKFLEGEDGD